MGPIPKKRGRPKKRFRRARAYAKSTVRRARRYGSRLRRAARGRTLGLVGKTGVGVAAGAPIALSALEAADEAIGDMRSLNLGIMSTAKVAAWAFLNNLSSGFGSGPLVSSVVVTKTDGSRSGLALTTRIPTGVWFKTFAVGGILVGWDIAVSWASRKFAKVSSGVRFMGTKLTGGK